MVYIYYLQLQDRIPEAISLFKKLDISALDESLQIQHDYLEAYFDIFTGAEEKYKVARTIVRKYDEHPVKHWRMMFLQIEDLLNDFDGEFNDLGEEMDNESELSDKLSSQASLKQKKREQMKKSKAQEPILMPAKIDPDGTLTLESTNIK